MPLFLAIDAGGTKAEYSLGDETREFARVRSGSIKRMRVDQETAAKHLRSALVELSRLTGIDLRQVTRTCVGTAGERVPLVADWLREEISAAVGGELVLVGDVEIALDAAVKGAAGVLVLAGTGSNVAARTPSGELMTSGGWGPLLGDEGSGLRIATEALRAVYALLDEGDVAPLLQRILDHWQLRDADELVERVYRKPSPDLAALAEIVTSAAAEGDQLALRVLQQQGELLGLTVLRLLDRAHFASSASIPVAFAGSILQHVEVVRSAVMKCVIAQYPTVTFCPGLVDPVDGALWRARQRQSAWRPPREISRV